MECVRWNVIRCAWGLQQPIQAIPKACGQPDPPTQSIHGLDPPRELKKFNTSQPNQLKQLKKLVLGGFRPDGNFFNFFNWFSWEVFNFSNSQRGQTARLEPLPASWPARPPDPGSGIVMFLNVLNFFNWAGTPSELKKMSNSQLNQLNKFKKCHMGGTPPGPIF